MGWHPSLIFNILTSYLNMMHIAASYTCSHTGYLACARCSSTGSLVLIEPVSTLNGGDQPLSPPKTERCSNCSGAGKVRVQCFSLLSYSFFLNEVLCMSTVTILPFFFPVPIMMNTHWMHYFPTYRFCRWCALRVYAQEWLWQVSTTQGSTPSTDLLGEFKC